jgi:hypothetical protein
MFNIATIDNGGGGADHETSGGVSLSFSEVPVGVAVMDVPNDQGGRVTVRWAASAGDRDVNHLRGYSIWRALPPGAPKAAGGRYRVARFAEGVPMDWEWLDDAPALRLPSYSYTARTLFDAMPGVDGTHQFMVVAHTKDMNEFYVSEPASGHSVDNLAPGAPKMAGAKQAAGEITVTWRPSPEADLAGYAIYRSSSALSDVTGLTPLATTVDSQFVDQTPGVGRNYYLVVAEDIHQNRGVPGALVSAFLPNSIGEGVLPTEYALKQNAPNPFNPSTTIQYHLADQVDVRLEVYDLLGRQIATLVSGPQSAGIYAAVWDGADHRGVPVASGVYLTRLTAGTFTAMQRMTLVR